MKKKVLLRSLLGFPLGIAIGHIISIIISLIFAQGYYSPCALSLVEAIGSEINAVIFQTILSGVLGSAIGACSIIWEIDNWSIAKQTGIFFLLMSLIMMPIAYFTHWMEHSILGFLSYFGIFVLIFIIFWVIQYLGWENKIKQLNSKL